MAVASRERNGRHRVTGKHMNAPPKTPTNTGSVSVSTEGMKLDSQNEVIDLSTVIESARLKAARRSVDLGR